MKTTMYAIIKKDFRGLAANRRLFIALLIVPLILTIVLPSIFLITIHFIPDDPDIMRLLDLLPEVPLWEKKNVIPLKHCSTARLLSSRFFGQRYGLLSF